MELYDDTYVVKKKGTQTSTILLIFIILLILLGIGLGYGIYYLKGQQFTVSVDDVKNNDIKDLLIFDESEGKTKIYVPIRAIASYLNYKDFAGDYRDLSEDTNKCHVKCDSETAMFTLGSTELFKIREESDYEYINLDEKVVQKDGVLYTTTDGIKKAFNVMFNYDEEKRKIEIYTMDYLVNYYSQNLKKQGFIETSDIFNDKKAIFDNMLIVQAEDKKIGVIQASTGGSILEAKYDGIEYLPKTGDFLVKSNNKYGIMTKEQNVKVKTIYDSIEIMDNDNGLYLVKQNGFYGVINIGGNIIISTEYEQIGVDNFNRFEANSLQSKYILANELVPLKKDGLWGFFNIKGEKITEFKYTSLGCMTSKVSNTSPLIVIPSHKAIIVAKDKMYNIMLSNGNEVLSDFLLDSAYLKSNNSGEIKYYLTFDNFNQTRDIEELLSQNGF